jgi:hypothetical protein
VGVVKTEMGLGIALITVGIMLTKPLTPLRSNESSDYLWKSGRASLSIPAEFPAFNSLHLWHFSSIAVFFISSTVFSSISSFSSFSSFLFFSDYLTNDFSTISSSISSTMDGSQVE